MVAHSCQSRTVVAAARLVHIGMKPPAPDGTPMPNDLLTGYIGQNEQTLISDTTIAAFADLGYTTFDPSAATSFLVDSGLILA